MDSLDFRTYIKYEQLDHVHFLGPDMLPHIDLYDEECCMYDFAQVYIDHDATELANNVNDYRTANEYVLILILILINYANLDLGWLGEILAFNTSIDGTYLIYVPEQLHMLEYYKG